MTRVLLMDVTSRVALKIHGGLVPFWTVRGIEQGKDLYRSAKYPKLLTMGGMWQSALEVHPRTRRLLVGDIVRG